jgi:arylsulfatase A-like enzyme
VLDGLARQASVHRATTPRRRLHADALRLHHRSLSAALSGRPRRAAAGSVSRNVGLPPEHPTVASLLKANGYDTSLVGKWHLGWKPEFGPNRHGFDEFFGILSGAGLLHAPSADWPGRAHAAASPTLWENLTPIERPAISPICSRTRRSRSSRGRARSRSFLSLQYNAPHSPWEGRRMRRSATRARSGPMVGRLAEDLRAMMKSMDAGIGRVLEGARARRSSSATRW